VNDRDATRTPGDSTTRPRLEATSSVGIFRLGKFVRIA
jgi:hypothetical protein